MDTRTDWAELLKASNFDANTTPTSIEVSMPTLDAIKRAYDAQVPATYTVQAWGVPIVVVDDVPEGRARFNYADGTVRVLPE